MSKKIDCIIVSGFLGSGKTTFVNQLLKQIDSQRNIAIAINDFGKVNLDMALINFPDERIISLNKGCMCCSLAAKFIKDFDKLYNEQPAIDTFIIEASGITNLDSLIQIIKSNPMKLKLNLTNVISTVNASNFIKVQKKLTIVKQQVTMANSIILNYKDKTSPELYQETIKLISILNPEANLCETAFSQIPLNFIDTNKRFSTWKQSDKGSISDEMYTGELLFEGTWNEDRIISIVKTFPNFIYRAKGIVHTKNGLKLIEKVDTEIKSKIFIGNTKNTNSITLIGYKPIDDIISKAISNFKNVKFQSNNLPLTHKLNSLF